VPHSKNFYQAILHEPYLITYLVSAACVKFVTVSLQRIVSGSELDVKILEKIIQEMDPSPWMEGMGRAIQAERIMGLEAADMMLTGSDLESLEFSAWEQIGLWFMRPMLKNEVIYMMKTYDLLEEAVSKPFYQAQGLVEDLEDRLASSPWYFVIADTIVPKASPVVVRQAGLEAMFYAVQIGAACKIYRSLQGRFPDKLEDLMTDTIDAVPLDPFTGKPFIYKSIGDGFVVYSLGSNQKDDEGRGTWQVTKIIMEKDDDWAWIEIP